MAKMSTCPTCGRKLRQLRNEKTGNKTNPNELSPFSHCDKCNRTYEE